MSQIMLVKLRFPHWVDECENILCTYIILHREAQMSSYGNIKQSTFITSVYTASYEEGNAFNTFVRPKRYIKYYFSTKCKDNFCLFIGKLHRAPLNHLHASNMLELLRSRNYNFIYFMMFELQNLKLHDKSALYSPVYLSLFAQYVICKDWIIISFIFHLKLKDSNVPLMFTKKM